MYVFSGGQPTQGQNRTGTHRHDLGGAADLYLVDPVTHHILDMRDPDDRVCMASFIQASVAAGATGVGAGLGYMGAHAMHIGGGAAAYWGGAEWVPAAYDARAGWAAGTPMPCTHAIDQARAGRDRRAQCKDDRLPGRGRRRGLQRQDDRIGVGYDQRKSQQAKKGHSLDERNASLLPGARTRTPVPRLTTSSRSSVIHATHTARYGRRARILLRPFGNHRFRCHQEASNRPRVL